jgi:hypothetical protein
VTTPTTCTNCGAAIPEREWNYPCEAQGQCFTCYFWLEKVPFANDPCSVRSEGTHYWIGEEHEERAFRGFGRRTFIIQFHDGRKVVSTNLWCQGDIPEHFREQLFDNADFIEETQS